jgi:hypothetical protein
MKRVLLLCFALVCITATPSISLTQVSDVTPPTLVNLSFSPAAIDTRYADQNVTITADITDDLSGFSYSYVYFRSPSGNQTQYGYMYYWNIVSGNVLNGKFRGTITFPKNSEAGTWTIYNVNLRDQAGNTAQLTTAQLLAAGIPASITVTSIPDTTPPTLTNISFSPQAVDVSSGARDVTVTFAVQDDLSGFDYSPYPGSRWSSYCLGARSSSGQYQYVIYDNIKLVSGTAQNGIFQGAFKIPQYAEAGDWQIYLSLYDKAGNNRFFYSGYNWPSGLPNKFTVISVPSDTTSPNLANLSFAPAFINTSQGAQIVDLYFSLTDNLSGMQAYIVQGQHGSMLYGIASITFQSPSGGQTVNGSVYQQSQLVSGTPLNSVWHGQMSFPRYSEAGTWKAVSAYLYDGVRNSRYLNTNDLIAAGFPTDIVIIKPSLGVDGTIDAANGGTIQDVTFGQYAQISAPPGVLGSGSIDVSIDVLSAPPNIPSPQGFGAAGSRFVNIQLTPEPIYPLPAPGFTLTIPLVQSNPPAPGTLLNLFRINSSTGALVPAFDAYGHPIVGAVNADRLSATFSGIISFSTVVALTPLPNIIPGDLNGDQVVNCADLKIVKASFGKRQGQSGYDSRADVNGDKVVDINDLMFVSKLLPAGTVCSN